MDERIRTLSRLESVPENEVVQEAKAWLSREGTRTLFDEPVFTTAFEALHVWRVRLKISNGKDKPLPGAEALVNRLSDLPANQKLEQLSFSGASEAGTVFFEKISGKYVGLVLSKRDAASPYARAC